LRQASFRLWRLALLVFLKKRKKKKEGGRRERRKRERVGVLHVSHQRAARILLVNHWQHLEDESDGVRAPRCCSAEKKKKRRGEGKRNGPGAAGRSGLSAGSRDPSTRLPLSLSSEGEREKEKRGVMPGPVPSVSSGVHSEKRA